MAWVRRPNILKIVGSALNSPELIDQDILIQGHTDSSGSSEYNKSLSEKRAETVKNFLVSAFDLSSSRFKVVGMGESDLLNPNDPLSSDNRRVQFVTTSE